MHMYLTIDYSVLMNTYSRTCEWGGHQELYAASQVFGVNIIVHQTSEGSSRFVIRSMDISVDRKVTDIHLSYHGECHYNSIRRLDDFDAVPATGIELTDSSGSRVVDRELEDAILMVKRSLHWFSDDEVRMIFVVD